MKNSMDTETLWWVQGIWQKKKWNFTWISASTSGSIDTELPYHVPRISWIMLVAILNRHLGKFPLRLEMESVSGVAESCRRHTCVGMKSGRSSLSGAETCKWYPQHGDGITGIVLQNHVEWLGFNLAVLSQVTRAKTCIRLRARDCEVNHNSKRVTGM
jgi:hypothetical protein